MAIDLAEFVSELYELAKETGTHRNKEELAKQIAEEYAERVAPGANNDEFDTIVKNTIPQVEYYLP